MESLLEPRVYAAVVGCRVLYPGEIDSREGRYRKQQQRHRASVPDGKQRFLGAPTKVLSPRRPSARRAHGPPERSRSQWGGHRQRLDRLGEGQIPTRKPAEEILPPQPAVGLQRAREHRIFLSGEGETLRCVHGGDNEGFKCKTVA